MNILNCLLSIYAYTHGLGLPQACLFFFPVMMANAEKHEQSWFQKK